MSKSAKGAMHFEGRKSIGALEANENQRRWDENHYKTVNRKPRHWYDITRAHLNFEIAKGGQIQKCGTSKSVDERWRERIAELGVNPNPLVSKHTPEDEFNKMQNQLVEFIFSGDHRTLNQMAFGSQSVDFANDRTADNSHIVREKPIEDWALSIYRWMSRKYGEENIVGFDVHLDETTAHIHASIIPVVPRADKRTGEIREVVSYKGHFGGLKSEGEQIMKDLHTELYEQVNCHFGLMRGEPVSQSGARHKNKIEMFYKLNDELPELEERTADLKDFIASMEKELSDIGRQIKEARSDLDDKRITKDSYERRVAALFERSARLKTKINERRNSLMLLENTIEEKRRLVEQVKVQTDVALRENVAVLDTFKHRSDVVIKGAVYDELLNGFHQLFHFIDRPSDQTLREINNPFLSDFFEGSLPDVITTASGMVIAAIDGVTTPTPSGGGGGGSSSDDKPKRDEDEDWLRFGHRVAMSAHARRKSAPKYGKGRH